MSDTSIGLSVLQALKDELVAQMPVKLQTFRKGDVKWYFTDTYIDPAMCPAICIVERGMQKTDETCRGGGLSGSTVGGMVWRTMAVEVRVWLKGGGTTDEDLRAKLLAWCGAVTAIVDASFQLEETTLIASTPGMSPPETMKVGQIWFGVGSVRVSVDVFTQQGAVAL
jgi:hypothetical protein